MWLLLILVAAAGLRLYGLDSVPPALSADEASNAYDGYCLLKTGMDRWGERWPMVLKAFGPADYRPALMAYLTVPFQALLGPELVVAASRMPSALLGVATVLCVYFLGRRAFGDRAGLLAAALLAVNPWHVILSRLAHESALTPFFPVLFLVCFYRAGVPIRRDGDDKNPVRLCWGWMIAGGAVLGASIYSYASAKLFMPALVLAVIVIHRRTWIGALRARRSALPVAAAILIALLVAGPMLWVSVTQWDTVNARAVSESVLHREASIGAAVATIARQYAAHFGLRWLFIQGHPYVDQSVPGFGVLHWTMLALLPAGLLAVLREWKRNRVCALLLLWLLIYPIASATTKGGVNAARAGVGLAVFPLLGGVGADWLLKLIRRPAMRNVASCALIVAIVGTGLLFASRYFTRWPLNPEVQARYQVEMRVAMDYLRGRRELFDHVFISDRRSMSRFWHTSEAYIFPLVYLPVEPAAFQDMDKLVIDPEPGPGFHYVARAGDFTFTVRSEALSQFLSAFPTARVLLIHRPGEVAGGRLVEEILRPSADPAHPPTACLELRAFDLSRERPILPVRQPVRPGES